MKNRFLKFLAKLPSMDNQKPSKSGARDQQINWVLIVCLLVVSTQVATAQRSSKPGTPPAGLSRSQIREAERQLSVMGYWGGAVDGVFDSATRSALIAFQKWEQRPVTGKLTIDELEAIRASAAPAASENWPRTKDVGYAHVEVDLERQVMLIVGDETQNVGASESRWAQESGTSKSGGAPDKSGLRAHSKVRVLPVSTGSGKPFTEEGQESVAYTPRGRFVVYDKSVGWEQGALGSMYYSNYISGGVAIHGHPNVPNEPASHGCIRIPMFAAREVSRLIKLGTIVLVYDKVSFVSAREWAENPELKRAVMLESKRPDYSYQIQGTSVIKKSRRRVNRAE